MSLQLTKEPKKRSEKNHSDHFLNDVLTGLQSNPKHLSSKYFYDKTGDELFQKIMAMPEYYLTRCELDIFKNKTSELAEAIRSDEQPFDLIELGAGDAMKSTYLLKYLSEKRADFTYMPIDISGNILSVLENNLKDKLPEINIKTLEGEYFQMLKKAMKLSSRRKVILFLGGNIGNMTSKEAEKFCTSLHQLLNSEDIVLIGFDLKKNPFTVLNAYSDKSGITAEFNLNLLTRINRELGGNFDIEQFEHYESYDPITGACRSFLISLKNQQVKIEEETIDFAENEVIDMEVSQKFSKSDIEYLAEKSGFSISRNISDSKEWFIDSIWKVNK
ncbi:L-histidine N(alpha)-methyltransferase [Chryseobacterium nepalense]|uniref:L-histidine N(Alpha)-methyltransferase n=1 Tax=Chryseobacterium nepalense TaxID=1854498 RepID=A0ABY4K6U9_9FLAO|nr:L-histidine N(alpha)-methyltransferase [Chryseobacterium nepalense]UPQ76289.1 L-histidine N(alpha)-methyltransferase [Chryseobacterium nepalense]